MALSSLKLFKRAYLFALQHLKSQVCKQAQPGQLVDKAVSDQQVRSVQLGLKV